MSEVASQEKNVLWVCRENIGRSQVAMELWNEQYGNTSFSAGIKASTHWGTVGECDYAQTLIQVMQRQHGIDIGKNGIRSIDNISDATLERLALIVVLSEPEIIPAELTERKNVLKLEIEDMKTTSYEATEQIVGIIMGAVSKVASKLREEEQSI